MFQSNENDFSLVTTFDHFLKERSKSDSVRKTIVKFMYPNLCEQKDYNYVSGGEKVSAKFQKSVIVLVDQYTAQQFCRKKIPLLLFKKMVKYHGRRSRSRSRYFRKAGNFWTQ